MGRQVAEAVEGANLEAFFLGSKATGDEAATRLHVRANVADALVGVVEREYLALHHGRAVVVPHGRVFTVFGDAKGHASGGCGCFGGAICGWVARGLAVDDVGVAMIAVARSKANGAVRLRDEVQAGALAVAFVLFQLVEDVRGRFGGALRVFHLVQEADISIMHALDLRVLLLNDLCQSSALLRQGFDLLDQSLEGGIGIVRHW